MTQSKLGHRQQAYMLSHMLREDIATALESNTLDFDTVERDCFDHRSGHTTRPTGEYYMTFVVSGETKDRIDRLIKGGR